MVAKGAPDTAAERTPKATLVHGEPAHPDLQEYDHSRCVIYVALLNTSISRRAYITSVQVFDGRGREIDVTWSNQIDHLGSPIRPSSLMEVSGLCHVYVRRNDGEWLSTGTIKIKHSLAKKPLAVEIDPWK